MNYRQTDTHYDLPIEAMSAPSVSVVMSAYNEERFLSEAIESILNQTFHDFEFIIINDGSTDRTDAILAHYQQLDDRIRVYYQENRGLIASLNRGCYLAKGRYIARLDANDMASSNRFQLQFDVLEQDPELAAVGASMVLIDENEVPLRTVYYPNDKEVIKRSLQIHNCMAHTTVMMRREAFLTVGGYLRTFLHAEDYDLWLRYVEHGYDLINLTQPLVYCRIQGTGVSCSNLRQQIISVLGAQAAARIRRQTGRDPMCQVEQVTSDVLGELGVSSEVIQRAIVEAYLWWAPLMLQVGGEEIAFELLSEALACSRSEYMQRQVVADVYKVYARAYYTQGELLRSMVAMMNACFMQPALATKLLWQGLRRLFQLCGVPKLKNGFG